MEVAIGISTNDRILAVAEVRHGGTANSEVTQLTIMLGSEVEGTTKIVLCL